LLAAQAGAQPVPTTSNEVPADFAASASARVNYYRAMAKLPPIVDDPAISAGAMNHARYLVKNGIAGGDIVLDNQDLHFQMPQDAFRWEVKGKPFYTDDGASSGRDAVIVTAQTINLSGAEFVDRLMTMPFSGLIPIVPQFSVAGLGAYCEPGRCAIVIPYRFALEKTVRIALYDGPASDRFWNPNLGLIPMETGRLRSPVEFSARRRPRSACDLSGEKTIPIRCPHVPATKLRPALRFRFNSEKVTALTEVSKYPRTSSLAMGPRSTHA